MVTRLRKKNSVEIVTMKELLIRAHTGHKQQLDCTEVKGHGWLLAGSRRFQILE